MEGTFTKETCDSRLKKDYINWIWAGVVFMVISLLFLMVNMIFVIIPIELTRSLLFMVFLVIVTIILIHINQNLFRFNKIFNGGTELIFKTKGISIKKGVKKNLLESLKSSGYDLKKTTEPYFGPNFSTGDLYIVNGNKEQVVSYEFADGYRFYISKGAKRYEKKFENIFKNTLDNH